MNSKSPSLKELQHHLHSSHGDNSSSTSSRNTLHKFHGSKSVNNIKKLYFNRILIRSLIVVVWFVILAARARQDGSAQSDVGLLVHSSTRARATLPMQVHSCIISPRTDVAEQHKIWRCSVDCGHIPQFPRLLNEGLG